MRGSTVLIGALAVLGAAPAGTFAGEKAPKQARQYEVRCRFFDTGPDGEKTTAVLPVLTTVEAKRLRYQTGGTNSFSGSVLSGPSGGVPFGLDLSVTVRRLKNGKLRVAFAVKNTHTETDPNIARSQNVSLEAVRDVRPGKAVTIPLENDPKGREKATLELTVREAPE